VQLPDWPVQVPPPAGQSLSRLQEQPPACAPEHVSAVPHPAFASHELGVGGAHVPFTHIPLLQSVAWLATVHGPFATHVPVLPPLHVPLEHSAPV
jgi:hypothetical protein